MSAWCAPDEGASSEYELYSVMMHTGSAMAGHYFAYIKVASCLSASFCSLFSEHVCVLLQDLSSGAWMNFNDAQITAIPEDQVSRIVQRSDASVPAPESPSAGALPPTPPATSQEAATGASVPQPATRMSAVVASSSNAYMLVYRLRDGAFPGSARVPASPSSAADSTLVSAALLPEVGLHPSLCRSQSARVHTLLLMELCCRRLVLLR